MGHAFRGTGVRERRGSVYLLVLLVMLASLSLVSSLQHVLIRRTRVLAQQQTETQLRTALLLGMQEAGRILLEDRDFAVDGLRDSWMQPREFSTSEGVIVTLQLEDAQTRFNLNHLTLPPRPGVPLSWTRLFETLLQQQGLETDPERLRAFEDRLEEEDLWFESTAMLDLLLPELSDFFSQSDLFSALPHPASRPLALNINTARPEVLSVILGDSLQGWVDSILATREENPVRSLDAYLRPLPPAVQAAMQEVFDVRSEWMEARLTARKAETVRSLRVLFFRSGGTVEVKRCQW